MAALLAGQGKFDEEMHKEVLAIDTSTHGERSLEVARTRNLGILARKQDKQLEARVFLEPDLALKCETLGPWSPSAVGGTGHGRGQEAEAG